MTSSPLFIIVAESIVFLVPMRQVGCASAASRFAPCISSARRAPKRSAGGGEHDRGDSRTFLADEALEDRAVLAVDRQQARAARARRCDEAARPRRRSALCWRRQRRCRVRPLQRPRRTRPRRRWPQAGPRVRSRLRRACSPSGPSAAVVAMRDPKARDLRGQQLEVAPGRKTDDLKAFRVPRDDVERLRPDRSRRAENRDPFASDHCNCRTPTRCSVAKNVTPPKR